MTKKKQQTFWALFSTANRPINQIHDDCLTCVFKKRSDAVSYAGKIESEAILDLQTGNDSYFKDVRRVRIVEVKKK